MLSLNLLEFLKILSNWKWFVISFIVTISIAYNVNIRKEKVYGMESSIVVKDENNPFFTANTSLVFNLLLFGLQAQKVFYTFNVLDIKGVKNRNRYTINM